MPTTSLIFIYLVFTIIFILSMYWTGYKECRTVRTADLLGSKWRICYVEGKEIIRRKLIENNIKFTEYYWFPDEGRFSIHYNHISFHWKFPKIEQELIKELEQMMIDNNF